MACEAKSFSFLFFPADFLPFFLTNNLLDVVHEMDGEVGSDVSNTRELCVFERVCLEKEKRPSWKDSQPLVRDVLAYDVLFFEGPEQDIFFLDFVRIDFDEMVSSREKNEE